MSAFIAGALVSAGLFWLGFVAGRIYEASETVSEVQE